MHMNKMQNIKRVGYANWCYCWDYFTIFGGGIFGIFPKNPALNSLCSSLAGSWCCLYFPSGLFVFSWISRRFVFSVTFVRPFLFSRHVIKSAFPNSEIREGKMHLDDDNEAKCLFIKTKKKTTNAREADGALCRPRRTRPRPGRITELVVNMYCAYKMQ